MQVKKDNIQLISLVSRQIWPQVLAAAHFKPSRLFLLHSSAPDESAGPARRLKSFISRTNMIPGGKVSLLEIPFDDFNGIQDRLADLKVDWDNSWLNITGGNKLMVLAAARWAQAERGRFFYLERGFNLFCFDCRSGEVRVDEEKIDGHITDRVDPVALVRCHLSGSAVKRVGERIRLNSPGRSVSGGELDKKFREGVDPRRYLSTSGRVGGEAQKGDRLEYLTALFLLKLGVEEVVHGLELKSGEGGGRPFLTHSEIDLIFNYGGRTWVVDCKDQRGKEWVVRSAARHLPPESRALERIRNGFKSIQVREMKKDIMDAGEIGGLQPIIICIRRTGFTAKEEGYARENSINLILKRGMRGGLNTLLHPEQLAAYSSLTELKRLWDQT